MCQDSSHLRRDRPFFSSSSSNKASSSNRVSSNSRGLDLPSSSHQPPLSCDPNPSLLHCLIHLVFQTCKMSFKRRNDSGGEASASSVRISLLLIFPTFLFQGEAESKAGCCSLVKHAVHQVFMIILSLKKSQQSFLFSFTKSEVKLDGEKADTKDNNYQNIQVKLFRI